MANAAINTWTNLPSSTKVLRVEGDLASQALSTSVLTTFEVLQASNINFACNLTLPNLKSLHLSRQYTDLNSVFECFSKSKNLLEIGIHLRLDQMACDTLSSFLASFTKLQVFDLTAKKITGIDQIELALHTNKQLALLKIDLNFQVHLIDPVSDTLTHMVLRASSFRSSSFKYRNLKSCRIHVSVLSRWKKVLQFLSHKIKMFELRTDRVRSPIPLDELESSLRQPSPFKCLSYFRYIGEVDCSRVKIQFISQVPQSHTGPIDTDLFERKTNAALGSKLLDGSSVKFSFNQRNDQLLLFTFIASCKPCLITAHVVF